MNRTFEISEEYIEEFKANKQEILNNLNETIFIDKGIKNALYLDRGKYDNRDVFVYSPIKNFPLFLKAYTYRICVQNDVRIYDQKTEDYFNEKLNQFICNLNCKYEPLGDNYNSWSNHISTDDRLNSLARLDNKYKYVIGDLVFVLVAYYFEHNKDAHTITDKTKLALFNIFDSILENDDLYSSKMKNLWYSFRDEVLNKKENRDRLLFKSTWLINFTDLEWFINIVVNYFKNKEEF